MKFGILLALVPTNYITTSFGVKIAIYESAGGLDDDKFFLLHGNSLSSGIYQDILNSPSMKRYRCCDCVSHLVDVLTGMYFY